MTIPSHLEGRLRAYAQSLLRSWPAVASKVDADDLLQEVNIELLKNPQPANEERPLKYYKTAVHNKAVDISRQNRLERADSDSAIEKASAHRRDDDPTVKLTSDADYRAWTTELQSAFGFLGQQRFDVSEVDYFAVVAVLTRSVLTKRLGKASADGPLGMVATVERLAPWKPAERGRSFRRGWPAIGDLWDTLRNDVENPPFSVGPDVLAKRLAALSNDEVVLTRDLWYQWVRRAKKWAKTSLPENTWQLAFEPLFPNKKRGR